MPQPSGDSTTFVAHPSSAASSPQPTTPLGSPQPVPLEGTVLDFQPNGMAWIQADLPVDLPEALPGEHVRYLELGRGAHRARGALIDVLEPHPARIAPRCPLFHPCGSCDRMQLAIEAQRALKLARVQEALHRFDVRVEPIVASPLEWGYRRRAKFTFFGQSDALQLGAYRVGSHDLIDLGGCPVTDPALLQARDTIARELSRHGLEPYHEASGTGQLRHLLLQIDPESRAILAVLVVARAEGPNWEAIAMALLDTPGGLAGIALNLQPARGNALLGHELRHLAGARALTLQVGDRLLSLPAGVFSQVNLEVAERLYREAVMWAGDLESVADSSPEAGALDLFCGVGALGLHLGDRLAWGIGIESHPEAARAARASADLNGLSRWKFLAGEVNEILPRLELPGPVAVAIVNPPRKGLGPVAVDALLERSPSRLLYVSCNPTSLAADLFRMTAAGYRVARARAFDMFPQTHHVETLVALDAPG